MLRVFCFIFAFIGWFGKFIPQVLFRLLVAWYFWAPGIKMFHGLVESVPAQKIMPFSMLGDKTSFMLIMWLELATAFFILVGFLTRIVTVPLLLIMIGVIVSYFPETFSFNSILPFNEFWQEIDGKNPAFKFDFAILLILISLFLSGAGGLSLDSIFKMSNCHKKKQEDEDLQNLKKVDKAEARRAEKKANKELTVDEFLDKNLS